MMLEHGPMMYAGGGFPWGLLIVGGILYFLWRNGMFDRGGRFGHGPRYGGGYGPGYPPAPMPGPGAPEQGDNPVFGGPRAMFEEWHRQAHEAERAAAQAPATPAAPAAPAANDAPGRGNDQPVG